MLKSSSDSDEREKERGHSNGQGSSEDQGEGSCEEEADEARCRQEARREAPVTEGGSSVRRLPRLGTRAEQRTSPPQLAFRLVSEAGDRKRVSGLRVFWRLAFWSVAHFLKHPI